MKNVEKKSEFRKKNRRFLMIAIIDLLVMTCFFIGLAIFMDVQNTKSTNEIASTYVNGVARQIVNHYETITSIRKDEGYQIINHLDGVYDSNEIREKIASQS